MILRLETKNCNFQEKRRIIKGSSANKMSLKLKYQHLTPFHCNFVNDFRRH